MPRTTPLGEALGRPSKHSSTHTWHNLLIDGAMQRGWRACGAGLARGMSAYHRESVDDERYDSAELRRARAEDRDWRRRRCDAESRDDVARGDARGERGWKAFAHAQRTGADPSPATGPTSDWSAYHAHDPRADEVDSAMGRAKPGTAESPADNTRSEAIRRGGPALRELLTSASRTSSARARRPSRGRKDTSPGCGKARRADRLANRGQFGVQNVIGTPSCSERQQPPNYGPYTPPITFFGPWNHAGVIVALIYAAYCRCGASARGPKRGFI